MDYDTWLQSGPGGPFDEPTPGGNFDFNTRLRGGTARVIGSATLEFEQDYDGKRSYWDIKFIATWTFHPEAEVDLSQDEVKELEEIIIEMMEDV